MPYSLLLLLLLLFIIITTTLLLLISIVIIIIMHTIAIKREAERHLHEQRGHRLDQRREPAADCPEDRAGPRLSDAHRRGILLCHITLYYTI